MSAVGNGAGSSLKSQVDGKYLLGLIKMDNRWGDEVWSWSRWAQTDEDYWTS